MKIFLGPYNTLFISYSMQNRRHVKYFYNRGMNHSDKANKLKYIILSTITTIIEKNLSKLNIKFVTTTSETTRDLVNTK